MKTRLSMILLCFLLAGCTWDKQDTGMAAGGVLGGVAGHYISGGSALGTGVGAVGGAVVGRQLTK